MSKKVVYSWKDEEQGIVQRKETGTYESVTPISLPDMEAKLATVEAKAAEIKAEIAEVKRGLVYPAMNTAELDELGAPWSASGLTKAQKIEELISN